MSSSLICTRSFDFAVQVLKLCDQAWDRGPSARHVAKQLLESSTSIGANAEEAQEGQTKADFIAKLSVSRKEARETIFWLRLALAAEILRKGEGLAELNEAKQLLAMIRSAIKTARESNSRGGN